MPEVSAIQVAREFARLAEANQGRLTAMKIQKLLYYAQAWSQYERGEDLFVERVKAWERGPVVPQVYKVFEGLLDVPTDHAQLKGDSNLGDDDRDLVKSVWTLYGHHTGDELSEMTHEHEAWERARSKAAWYNNSPVVDPADMRREIDRALREEQARLQSFIAGLSVPVDNVEQ